VGPGPWHLLRGIWRVVPGPFRPSVSTTLAENRNIYECVIHQPGMMTVEERIRELCTEKNAVILAHNYQRPEVQAVADHVGDSFVLARRVSSTDAEVIVFCGVDFMAESAKILNPERTVIHPVVESRCPMAAMAEVELVRALKSKHPDARVVSYINTSADVKAESDICCTSGNAVDVIRSIPEKKIIFVPDRNLGMYVQRSFPDKEIILWPGYCHVHQDDITVQLIKEAKEKHPHGVVMAHPECTPEVIDMADVVASTEGMIRHLRDVKEGTFIVGTEEGMIVRLQKENPNVTFIPVHGALCPNMKRITLESIARSLEEMGPTVQVDMEVARKAKVALDRMLEVGRSAADEKKD